MELTKNFTLEEMTRSDYAIRHGIDNSPTREAVMNLKALCVNVLQPLRNELATPIIPSSGYRSLPVNRGVGSADTSQHPKGEAVDFRALGVSIVKIFETIIRMKLPFDQVIDEYGSWVHVSHTSERPNRNMKLLARHDEQGKVVYRVWEEA